MKKKTMQILFVLLFAIGFIVGFIIPWDIRDVQEATEKKLEPQVFDIARKFGQLEHETKYFRYSVLADVDSGSVDLLRIDEKIPNHLHAKEHHFVYIYRGKVKVMTGGKTLEAGQGQMIFLPAGVPHKVERIGDIPVEVILFSTPTFDKNDITWIEKID